MRVRVKRYPIAFTTAEEAAVDVAPPESKPAVGSTWVPTDAQLIRETSTVALLVAWCERPIG